MSILKELLAEASDKSPEVLLKVVKQAEAKLAKVETAMAEVKELTSTLPSLFRTHIHAGNVHNLDHPKEYSIWVGIENVKGLYTMSQELRDTKRAIEQLKSQLSSYTKK